MFVSRKRHCSMVLAVKASVIQFGILPRINSRVSPRERNTKVLVNPGEYGSPDRVWCSWDNSRQHLTLFQREMVIRLANAELVASPGELRYLPVAWDGSNRPVLCVDTSQSDETAGWVYVTELFDWLPDDLQKLVIYS